MNISLSDQNCLSRYRSNPSIGQTGPDGQNIPGHRDLLINENAFCGRQYLITLTIRLSFHISIY